MKNYDKLEKMLCKELEKMSEKGDLTPTSLETIHKLTDTIKNLSKIEMLEHEKEGGYSERRYSRDGYSSDGYSERRMYSRDGDWEARGNYSRNYSYDDNGSSYANPNGAHYIDGEYSMRGYSRDDGKEHMLQTMRKMMDNAGNAKEREAIRTCLLELEKA